MRLTNFNDNLTTHFLPLIVLLGLLAEYTTAEFCCYVGGCSGTDPTCVPCKIMTSCGQFPLCMGYTCQSASAGEGVLSPETVAAAARKLRQGAVEWRKAKEEALEGPKAKGNLNEHEADGAVEKRGGQEKANDEVMEV